MRKRLLGLVLGLVILAIGLRFVGLPASVWPHCGISTISFAGIIWWTFEDRSTKGLRDFGDDGWIRLTGLDTATYISAEGQERRLSLGGKPPDLSNCL